MKQSQIQLNLLDKVVKTFSPERALKRYKARALLALHESYNGSSKSRRSMRRYNPKGDDPDSNMLHEFETARNRSRDLVRNSTIGCGAISSTTTAVVGTGIKLQSRIDREILGLSEEEANNKEKEIEKAFKYWAETSECDSARTLNFYGLQELAFRQVLENGESFVNLPRYMRQGSPFRLKVQLIEGDRIINPRGKFNGKLDGGNILFEGIEKKPDGSPKRYYIAQEHPGSISRRNYECDPIEVFGSRTGLRNILHLYRMLRPGQSRGIPFLSPVIEPLKQLDRYTEAEIMAAVITGMYTVFITSEDDGSAEEKNEDYNAKDDEIVLGSGSTVTLNPGEKVDTTTPGRPNTAFDPFVMSIFRQIGIALEIPYEVLIKHFTASYSAAKAALLEAYKFYMGRRKWLIDYFCKPVYEIWMWDAVSSGMIKAPGFFKDYRIRKAYLGSQWVGDSPGQLDPVKEVQAAEKRLQLYLSTIDEETKSLTGGDFETNIKQIDKERNMLAERGLKEPFGSQGTVEKEEPIDNDEVNPDKEDGDNEAA